MHRWRTSVRTWLARQVLDSLGDTAFAAVSFVLGLGLLGLALWENWDMTGLLNFNLSVVHFLTSQMPVIGQRAEFLLRMFGIDHILFFTELWAFVALILRIVGLTFGYLRRWLWRRFREQ